MRNLSALKIALIGGGNMARGLIGGLLGQGAAARIVVSNPSPRVRGAGRDYGVVRPTKRAASHADVVVLPARQIGQ
jgi:pyrroline-5-carboxylate reductase